MTDKYASDAEKAIQRFKDGYTCSMAVASAFGTRFGVDEDTLCKSSCGFAGGFGGLGATCGAVAGAVMVLGLKLAPEDPLDKKGRQDLWEQVRRFMADFEIEHGSCDCAELIEKDISNAEGVQAARDDGTFLRVCPPLVATASKLLESYLDKVKPSA